MGVKKISLVGDFHNRDKNEHVLTKLIGTISFTGNVILRRET